jgi:hypothetical protein
MTELLNLNGLLGETSGYLDAIRVPDIDEKELTRARELIRETLRAAFRQPETFINKRAIFEDRAPVDPEREKLRAPKFRLQGSFKYGTANDCQINPPQEIDQDDGVFLPVSFFETQFGPRPVIASEAYFSLIEHALQPLADREGWALDKTKDTCVRIRLSERLHMDLPLYVVADGAFSLLAKADARARLMNEDSYRREIELTDRVYNSLGEDQILLAHRKKRWIESDPRTIEKWFANAVGLHGSILRRLSRGYKGMRDAHEMDDDIGSIGVMVGVVEAYGRVGKPPSGREDIAFRDVAREMARVFEGPVYNPAFPNDDEHRLCQDWDADTRRRICVLFEETADHLDFATTGTSDKSMSLHRARLAFGDRVPDDTTLIKEVGEAGRIRSQEPKPQPTPMVPRYRSG